MAKKILLIEPRGFCAGVERAIDIVERAISKYGAPIYVRHEIVHNKKVVQDLTEKGAIFVKEIDEVPQGAVVIFSAHGVSEEVESNAYKIGLNPIDATCPLVKKVHNQARHYENKNREIILIGHSGHPEVIGTIGRVKRHVHIVENVADVERLTINGPLAYITQTTLSYDDTKPIIEALKAKFTDIVGPNLDDICYATQNRQMAVKRACEEVDLMLVVGSKNSSNSNRLRDVAINSGVNAYLINDYSEIDKSWFNGNINTIGITAGASAPEELVMGLVEYLKNLFNIEEVISENFGIVENVKFNLPRQLSSL
jgi:4-hydroxy-3-methylbut-2-enyl diphosphate reductase